MCGIAGVLANRGNDLEATLSSMLSSIEHRGPDDRGTYFSERFAFGMNRLSIIDLSSGNQPIFNEDRSLVIVFNGEIYNYQELREFLLSRGHVFSTKSDTEVILHLYEELGEDSFSKLRGMFAFAIWDTTKQELLLVRDHFGIKPLFYFENESGFYFASEIKCFFSVPGFKKALEVPSLVSHLSLLFTNSVDTLFKDVRKLAPGHCMKVSGVGKVLKKYFQLSVTPTSLTGRQERKQYIKEVLRESVRAHLISDVPLGVMLSGGVDSSLLLALMKEEVGDGIKSFSIGYEEGGGLFDERRFSDAVSCHVGSDHKECILTSAMIKDSITKVLLSLDEPFANASVFANYFLSQYIANDVKVVLSGLGGDEVAGGYERYRGMYLADKFFLNTMRPLTGMISGMLWGLKDSATGHPFSERLKRFFLYAAKPPSERYFSFLSKFSLSEHESMFTKRVRDQLEGYSESPRVWCEELYFQSQSSSSVTSSCYVDMHTYLVEDLLALSDRCSMAASLEMRVPFVDRVLIDAFYSLPDSDKMSMFETKVLLKEIAAEYLPRDIVYRRKQGFSVPITVWFRDILKPFLLEHLSPESLASVGVFNPAYVNTILNDHLEGKRNYDEKLFSILSFTLWCKAHGITTLG